MLTPEEIKAKLIHPAFNLSYLSREVGIGYMTLWKLANGKLKVIPYDLVKKLSDYFNAA